MASVLAALRSRLASSVSRFLRTFSAFSVVLTDLETVIILGLTGTARDEDSAPLQVLVTVSSITLAAVGGMSIVKAVVCCPSSPCREFPGDPAVESGAATTGMAPPVTSSLLVLAGGSSSLMCSDSSAEDELLHRNQLQSMNLRLRLSPVSPR